MCPEQIRDEIPDGRGGHLQLRLHAVTNWRPAGRRSAGLARNDLLSKHFAEKPAPPSAYNPDVTDEFAAFVLKLLAKKKEDRPGELPRSADRAAEGAADLQVACRNRATRTK